MKKISGAFDLLDITSLIVDQCKLFYEKSLLLYPLYVNEKK